MTDRAAELLAEWPGTMLASKLNVSKIEYPCAVELKLDGVRLLVIVRHGANGEYEVQTLSRAGKEFTSLEPIKQAILDALAETSIDHDVVFDGEVFCGDFKTTVSEVRKKDKPAENAVFHIFDMFPLETLEDVNAKHTSRMYKRRRKDLAEFWQSGKPDAGRLRMSEAVLCHTEEGLWALYKRAREEGIEGVIVKELNGYWWKRRNRSWMKIKDKKTADCQIVDAFVGEGKCSDMLGNLVVLHGEVRVSVGTGFTDAQREKMWAQYLRDTSRLEETGGDLTDERLELLGKTAELSYHEETPDGSLRHPVFESIRIDK